jgi:hypothetical protein
VIAVDSFPYLVAVGLDLASRHIEEASRVLAPGGTLLILNFSYSGGIEADRLTVGSLSRNSGFALIQNGVQPFALWDGAVFELRKPNRRAERDV